MLPRALGGQGAADVYVWAASRLCEDLQCLAARYGRQALAGGPDLYGDEDLLEGLAKHLHSRGVDEEAVQAQLRRLRGADYGLDPNPSASLGKQPGA